MGTRVEVITVGEVLAEFLSMGQGQYSGPHAGGAPAIFAAVSSRLGHRCAFFSAVGQDAFGRLLTERLVAENVGVSGLRRLPDRTTAVAFVTYQPDGSREFVFHLRHAAAGAVAPAQLDQALIRRARHLHLSGSALAVSESSARACLAAARTARAAGLAISFDPNVRRELLPPKALRERCAPLLDLMDYFLPSEGEGELMTGARTMESAARAVLRRGTKAVVQKLSSRGCMVYTAEGGAYVPAYKVQVADPTGAGDSFSAGLVAALLEGEDLGTAAHYANAAAALAVSKVGAMEGGTPEEIRRLMAQQ
ncbi:MAG: sugar kinase [Deinococcus sp.]|nr:sugar kinase [Deinococcus sp.]